MFCKLIFRLFSWFTVFCYGGKNILQRNHPIACILRKLYFDKSLIQQLEGDEGYNHIAEYVDSRTEQGQVLLKSICDEMGFDSLGYQSLDGLLEAIGLNRDKICTYCWTDEK